MDNITLRFVFDKKKKATLSKQGLLQVEVRINGSKRCIYISTGIKLYSNQYSDKMGFTCINHDKAMMINKKARGIFSQIESYAETCNSIEDIHNWNKSESNNSSPVEFIKDRLKKKNPSFSVVEYHNSLIKRIEEFGKFRTFDDLTYINMLDFDAFLRKTIKSQPTLYKRHIALKSYIKMAVKAGLCKYNPYDDFEFKKGKSREAIFLTEDEVKLIQDYNPPSDSLKRIKDLFIVQCFTGMAYVDLMSFTESKISIRNNRKIITGIREKTDESYISLLLPEAEMILEKYNYVLPRITNEKYNDYLKLLAAGAGINKNITTHVARHTYATYLLNRGIPVETVSRTLGHTNIKQTQAYARMLGSKVLSDMEVLFKTLDNK